MIPPKMGKIEAIWIKRFKHGPMDPVSEAEAVEGRGLKDNANQGGKRQITIIDEARWREVQEELGVDVDPRTRRANLMLRGIDLERTNGRELRLGECLVRILRRDAPVQSDGRGPARPARGAVTPLARRRVR